MTGASTKQRTVHRWTKAKDLEVREAIYDVLAEDHPASVRGVYYRVLSRGLFEKDENNYRKVQQRVLDMRRRGDLPYAWITDGTRMRLKPRSWADVDDALFHTARTYRRNLWGDQGVHVEVWTEKDAMKGVLYEATAEWDVPLPIARGFSSESFLYASAAEIASIGKPTYIYFFADYDQAGLDLVRQVEETLPRFAPDVPITVVRAAVTEQQIDDLELITRDPTAKDRRNGWTRCVEVDAVPPRVLRDLARSCIESHVDQGQLAMTKRVEAEERSILSEIIGGDA